jgi:tellurite methyltransferase
MNESGGAGMLMPQPWWETTYDDLDTPSFGPIGDEYISLASVLPARARVLDMGCGDGRHAVFFARQGFDVTAFDRSSAAIRKTRYRAQLAGAKLGASVSDLTEYQFNQNFDLVIAHSVLQFVPRPVWRRVVGDIKANTVPGGWNAVTVTVDGPAPDDDLVSIVRGPFSEGELAPMYFGWNISASSYVSACSHNGVLHHHAMNKVVARRPAAGMP